MNRINVVGTSGTGKSTFARELSDALNIPYLEMDALFWKPNWTESSDEEFFARLEEELSIEQWVLDGNYNRTVPVKWRNVDTVIWLDYSKTRTLLQAVRRAFIRSVTKQALWGKSGNVESFRKSFFSGDSIILWTMKSYHSNRKRYQGMMNDSKFSHIKFAHITSPEMARKYIENSGQNLD